MFQYFSEEDVAVATLPDGQVLLLSRSEQPVLDTFVAVDARGRNRTQEAVDTGLRRRFLVAADSAVAHGLLLASGDEDMEEEFALQASGLLAPDASDDQIPIVWIDPGIVEEERWAFAARMVSHRNTVNEDPSATAEAYEELFVRPSLDGWLRAMRSLHLLPANGYLAQAEHIKLTRKLQQRSPGWLQTRQIILRLRSRLRFRPSTWKLRITADESPEGGVWDGNLLRMGWDELSTTAILALGPDGYIDREDYEAAQISLADESNEADRQADDVLGKFR